VIAGADVIMGTLVLTALAGYIIYWCNSGGLRCLIGDLIRIFSKAVGAMELPKVLITV